MSRPLPAEPASRAIELVAFYRSTHYAVTLPDGSTASIRVGESAPAAIAAWIGPSPCAWYLTACNPRSEPLPDAGNEARMSALRDDFTRAGCRFLSGVASIPGQAWRERSFLVAGLGAATAATLLERYGQNAAVRVPRNGPATLWLQRADWRGHVADAADLEWPSGQGSPS